MYYMSRCTLIVFMAGCSLIVSSCQTDLANRTADEASRIESDIGIPEVEDLKSDRYQFVESVLALPEFSYNVAVAKITADDARHLAKIIDEHPSPMIRNLAFAALMYLHEADNYTKEIFDYSRTKIEWNRYDKYEQVALFMGKARAIRALGVSAGTSQIALLEQAMVDSSFCVELTQEWANQGSESKFGFTPEDVVVQCHSAAAEGLVLARRGDLVRDYLNTLNENELQGKDDGALDSDSMALLIPELLSALVDERIIEDRGIAGLWILRDSVDLYSHESRMYYLELRQEFVEKYGDF